MIAHRNYDQSLKRDEKRQTILIKNDAAKESLCLRKAIKERKAVQNKTKDITRQ